MSDLLRFDLSKNSIGRPIVYGRVGDGESFSMRVQIFKDGAPFDLTDWVATFEGVTHEERTKVFDSDGIEITNGKNGEFTYTFPNMAFAVAGSYELAYFSFMKDDKRESTDDFEITVYGNADIDAEEAKTIITEYNKLVKALNEAYQSALEKIDTDYDAVVKRIETIKTEMNTLQTQIDKTVSDAEGRISKVATDSENKINQAGKTVETNITAIGKTVTDAMNAALEELRAADFYTQAESDAKFLAKFDASTTYATKADTYTKSESDIAYAKKEDTVNLTGNQDIAGVKNFTDGLQLQGLSVLIGAIERAITDEDRNDKINITGVNGSIHRMGNLVFIAINFTCQTWPTGTETRWAINVPKGFQRTANNPAFIPLSLSRNANQPADARAFIDQDNVIQVKSGNGSSYVSGMWVTQDVFPK